MNEIIIKSFIDYLSYVEKNYSRNHIFRGMNDLKYLLIPKIGREPYVSRCRADFVADDLQDMEEQIMHEFIKMSIPHMDLRNISFWDQWTIGQHHGLPTRFLDWTENPLIAAYFATENSNSNDVAVYVVDKTQLNSNTDEDLDVFSLSDEDEVVLYAPSYIHPRIIAQKGLFTVHRNPTIPLDKIQINGKFCVVDKLIVPNNIIKDFVSDLDWFGVNRSFIYPGLDGLAYHLDCKAKGEI